MNTAPGVEEQWSSTGSVDLGQLPPMHPAALCLPQQQDGGKIWGLYVVLAETVGSNPLSWVWCCGEGIWHVPKRYRGVQGSLPLRPTALLTHALHEGDLPSHRSLDEEGQPRATARGAVIIH